MKPRLKFLPILFIFFFLNSSAQKNNQESEVRTLVTLLDYIAKDYPGAVNNGKVISETEFQEIIEFTQHCIILQQKSEQGINKPSFTKLKDNLHQLLAAIRNKASNHDIAFQAKLTKEKILAMGLMSLSPKDWPSLRAGKIIYTKNCVSCHGETGRGDGISAIKLIPKPSNFRDPEVMAQLSPLQAYNIIKLGLRGTPMRSFSELSEKELWDISFYIMSLRHQEMQQKPASPMQPGIETVSRLTDDEMRDYLQKHHIQISLAQLRTYQPAVIRPLDLAKIKLQESLAAYRNKDKSKARDLALTAYLEGVELVEASIKAMDPAIVVNIEKSMASYRTALQGDNHQLVEALNLNARNEIETAAHLLDSKAYSYSFTYGAALSILLREALEALIIIIVVLSILKPLKIRKAIIFIHAGWISALITGALSWFFIDILIKMSGSSREVLEGAGSMIAVVVLVYMGTWLHSKSEVKKWKEFVELKISKVSESGNWYLLMFFSFVVVFREAFEVVLFLATLKLDVPEDGTSAIGWAVVTAAILVTIFAVLMLRYSRKLPLKQIFKFSSYIMVILTVVLTGKGAHAFQEAGYLNSTYVNETVRFEALGIYPTLESLSVQLLMIMLLIGLWLYTQKNIEK